MNTPVIFNPFVPSYRRNPYLQLDRLRTADPVHRSDALQAWILTRYEDVLRVLRDHETFSSDSRNAGGQIAAAIAEQRDSSPLGDTRSVLASDPPEHTFLRGIVNRAFTPRSVEALRPRMEEITASLLGEAPETGEWDLVTGIAQPLPVIVIAELLGIPPEDRAQFKAWSDRIALTTDIMQSPETIESIRTATAEIIDYFGGHIEDRRRTPREDLISALVAAENEGRRLTGQEVLAFAILLLVAGNETTTNLIGAGMRALLAHPEAMAALRAEPDRIPAAIEEMLRYDSPVQGIVRFATREVQIGERTIAKGEVVMGMTGAANRDPAQFPDPAAFDLARTDARHLAFGQGIHYCVGAPLARVEAAIAFRALLTRWASIEAAGDAEIGGTFLIRGPVRLPLAVAR
ncbi:MAG: cytochrome P450 [Chloroflexi bacterium]|nr:cytochrome P450 [Chloroflexota bacterium]